MAGNRSAELWVEDGILVLRSDYDEGFIAGLKLGIPSYLREWGRHDGVWRVSLSCKDTLLKLLSDYDYYLVDRTAGTAEASRARVETVTIRMNYVGNARRRNDGTVTAFGMDERGDWVYILPLAALQAWFGVTANPSQASNYYEVLGVKEGATLAEIKSGYRKGAKLWHPDVSSDPDAAGIFGILTEAYRVLSSDEDRRRYDVARRLIGKAPASVNRTTDTTVWSVPDRYRCGYLDVEGEWAVGMANPKMRIVRILKWQDIINRAGQRMVSRWVRDSIDYSWV